MSSCISSAEAALSEYVGSMNDLQFQESRIDDETAFIYAMERIYCLARKKQRFKVVGVTPYFTFLLIPFKGVSSHGPKAPDSDDDFCNELPQMDTFVDFDEGLYPWTPSSDDHTDRFLAPSMSLLSDCSDDRILLSNEEQGVDILSDTSWDDAHHLFPSFWYDMEDLESDFDGDKADGALGSSFPERASVADLVLEANIPFDPCSDNESLYSFDGECSPIVISQNPRPMSLDLLESSDYFDIFETELSLPFSSAPVTFLPNSSTSEKTTALFDDPDTFEDDFPRDDTHHQGQTVSLPIETDISAKPLRRSASQGISWFDFALENDLGHQTTRQVSLSGGESASGVISAKKPCNFHGLDKSRLGPLPSSGNASITPDNIDFVVMDF
jgi:hypothetical protein